MDQQTFDKILEFIDQLDKGNTTNSKELLEDYIASLTNLTALANWKYFCSLKDQGFTEEQALSILLASANK